MRKVILLFTLLLKHPLEFYNRMMTFMNFWLEWFWVRSLKYEVINIEEGVEGIKKVFGREVHCFLNEQALDKIELEVCRRIDCICSNAPFTLAHNADLTLARFCYLACRLMKPNIVLETGVAYGVTSAFILKALEVNGQGMLHSVDLPPLGRDADQFVGILIPEGLKTRWRLHRGISRRILPRLLPNLGQVEIFLHDSLHTYQNIRREFRLVTRYLAPQSVVIVDDVDQNPAFQKWVDENSPIFQAIFQEKRKKALFGIAVKKDNA